MRKKYTTIVKIEEIGSDLSHGVTTRSLKDKKFDYFDDLVDDEFLDYYEQRPFIRLDQKASKKRKFTVEILESI